MEMLFNPFHYKQNKCDRWDKDKCDLDTWCCHRHDIRDKEDVFKALKKPDGQLPFEGKPKHMWYLTGNPSVIPSPLVIAK